MYQLLSIKLIKTVNFCCFNFCKEFKVYVSIFTFFCLTYSQSNRFILHGNVLDLVIDIIIRTAFTNVVQSFAGDIITPSFDLILRVVLILLI